MQAKAVHHVLRIFDVFGDRCCCVLFTEFAFIQACASRDLRKDVYIDHAPAIDVMRFLDCGDHRERLILCHGVRSQYRGDRRRRVPDRVGMVEQAAEIGRAEYLTSEIVDAPIGDPHLPALGFRQPNRVWNQVPCVKFNLQAGDVPGYFDE